MNMHRTREGMFFLPDDTEAKILELLGIHDEPGWVGSFTRREHPDGMPNGTRVVKVMCDKGDRQPLGSEGTVLGSVIRMPWEPMGYFIEWDALPRHAVFVMNFKIKAKAAQ